MRPASPLRRLESGVDAYVEKSRRAYIDGLIYSGPACCVDYKAAVERAAEKIAGEVRGGELKGRRVFILLPPGNSRPAVADALCSRLGNCAVFTYRQGKIDVGAVRRRAEAGVAVVVPRDISEAADLYKQLKDLRPVAVFLPAIYEEALKEAGVEAEEWQRADFRLVEELYGFRLRPRGVGVHLSLVREGVDKGAVGALRALMPEETGRRLLDRLRGLGFEAFGEAYKASLDLLLSVVIGAVLPWQGPAALARQVAKALFYKRGEALLDKLREQRARSALFEVLQAVLKLDEAATAAGDEKYEAALCEAAAKLGASCRELKDALAKYAAPRAPAEEAVDRALAQVQDEVEKLRKKMEEVEKRLRIVEASAGIHRGSLPEVAAEGGEYYLAAGLEKVRLVQEGGFGRLAEEVVEALRGGAVVLKGPRGAGKTTLALLAAQKWIEGGGLVARLGGVGRGAAEVFKTLAASGFTAAVVVDPSPLEVYLGRGLPLVEPVRLDADSVKRLIELSAVYRVPALIVLTEEEYDAYVRQYGPYENVFEVVQFEKEFYRGLVLEYGGDKAKALGREELDRLVGGVLKYRGAKALVAKYVGLALAEKGAETAEKALEAGVGDAKKFLREILRHFLELGERDLLRLEALRRIYHAKIFAVREIGVWDYVFPPMLVRELGNWSGQQISPAGAALLARWNEELVERSLLDLLWEDFLGKPPEERRQYSKAFFEGFWQWLGGVLKQFAEFARQLSHNNAVVETLGLALLGYAYAFSPTDERLVVGRVIPPGVVWLVNQAVRMGIPLIDPQVACQKLPDEIKEENTLQKAAVRAAYAYSALAADNCLEKALYALHWSLLFVGPLAEPAVNTALEAVRRAGAVEGAPQILWTVLNRYGRLLGVCEKAKSVLDKLYEGARRRSWVYTAYLAEAYATAAARCYLEKAASRAEELLGRLGEEERALAAEAYYSLAGWHLDNGRFDEARRYAERLEKAADELKKADRKKVEEYFKWKSLLPPEKAVEDCVRSLHGLAAGLRGRISLVEYVHGLADKPDAEAFAEEAEVYKNLYDEDKAPDDYVNYLTARGLHGKALFLAGKYDEAFKVFEETWGEASRELLPDARYLEAAASTLVHYAAALIREDRHDEAKKLLEEHKQLLTHYPRGWAALYLYAKALGAGGLVEKPPRLEEILLSDVIDAARPAVRLLITRASEKCEETCRKGRQCIDNCITLLAAAGGDELAAEIVREWVISSVRKKFASDISEVLRKFGISAEDYRLFGELGGAELVEVRAPRGTFGGMLFLFDALRRRRDDEAAGRQVGARLAEAHALRGALYAPRLFAEVYNALRGRREEELKTALAKLLLLHV